MDIYLEQIKQAYLESKQNHDNIIYKKKSTCCIPVNEKIPKNWKKASAAQILHSIHKGMPNFSPTEAACYAKIAQTVSDRKKNKLANSNCIRKFFSRLQNLIRHMGFQTSLEINDKIQKQLKLSEVSRTDNPNTKTPNTKMPDKINKTEGPNPNKKSGSTTNSKSKEPSKPSSIPNDKSRNQSIDQTITPKEGTQPEKNPAITPKEEAQPEKDPTITPKEETQPEKNPTITPKEGTQPENLDAFRDRWGSLIFNLPNLFAYSTELELINLHEVDNFVHYLLHEGKNTAGAAEFLVLCELYYFIHGSKEKIENLLTEISKKNSINNEAVRRNGMMSETITLIGSAIRDIKDPTKRLEVVRTLLDHGADVDVECFYYDGFYPLKLALGTGDLQLIKMISDSSSWTPEKKKEYVSEFLDNDYISDEIRNLFDIPKHSESEKS